MVQLGLKLWWNAAIWNGKNHSRWNAGVTFSELQILMCLFWWMLLVVIWGKSFWVLGNVNLVNATCWIVYKARLPVETDQLHTVCLLSAWKDHYYIANHLHEKSKLIKRWKIAPEWEDPGLLKPLLGDALGQAVSEQYKEEGESCFTQTGA